MNDRFYEAKKAESGLLDSDDYDENYLFQRKFYLENNESIKHDGKTEILWSRESKYIPENDFFINQDDYLSDLSGRSTSSCSWHNDDFDMKSSTKVSLSLEAVENALYEKKMSPLISEEVFQECFNWSNKFPYFRLKGEQIIKPLHESLQSDSTERISLNYKNSPLSLQLEGKKLSLHTPDKCIKKATETVPDSEQVTYFEEEIVAEDDGYDECFVSQCVNSENIHSEQPVNTENAASLNYLQDKVIEKLAQHVWPKVLEVLQKCHTAQNTTKSDESFQLPPIVAAQAEHKKIVPSQRPKTEGTSFSMLDFPKLNSILSVSPKVLQDRKDCRSGKSSIRSSRPSSEIHLSSRNVMVSSAHGKNTFQKSSRSLRTPITPKQVQFTSKVGIKFDEKYSDKVPLYLPALEEDTADPIDHLKGSSLQSDPKHISSTMTSHYPKNSECFLPPIDTNDHINTNVKLTRNLFTFFGPDLKCKDDIAHKPKTPGSRPNTCASKRGVKQAENLSYRFINDSTSSTNNLSQTKIRKCGSSSEKQVTLFPIVTSLFPSKEKITISTKKGPHHTLSERKR